MASTHETLPRLKTPPVPVPTAGGNRERGVIAVAASVLFNVPLIWIHSTPISPGNSSAEIRPLDIPPATVGRFPRETNSWSSRIIGGTNPAGSHAER
jgi:hypothetical protein